MSKAVILSRFNPSPSGHGGNHRSYQIVEDVRSVLGDDQVTILSFQDWAQKNKEEQFSAMRLLHTLKRILNKRRENPYAWFEKTNFVLSNHLPDKFIQQFKQTVLQEKPLICVLEDSRFSNLVEFNRQQNVITFCIPQNIESLDSITSSMKNGIITNKMGIDLVNELKSISRCDANFMISRVEAGIVGGLGITADFYPYLPTGEIKTELTEIRSKRTQTGIDRGLFLMVGSGIHETTREAFKWFLEQARQHGLPENSQVVICGKGTETLLSTGEAIPQIVIKGWVEQSELYQLLTQANAVLVPQFRGFGSLTRLPEMICAGILVIVSEHPTYASGQLPGLRVAGNNWDEWFNAMVHVQNDPPIPSETEYLEWESNQPNPLKQRILSIIREKGL